MLHNHSISVVLLANERGRRETYLPICTNYTLQFSSRSYVMRKRRRRRRWSQKEGFLTVSPLRVRRGETMRLCSSSLPPSAAFFPNCLAGIRSMHSSPLLPLFLRKLDPPHLMMKLQSGLSFVLPSLPPSNTGRPFQSSFTHRPLRIKYRALFEAPDMCTCVL